MAIYSYVKSNHKKTKNTNKYISFFCIIFGVFLIIWVLFPIIQFELFYAPKFGSLLTPTNDISLLNDTYELSTLPSILGIDRIDYTKASVWFPKSSEITFPKTFSSYKLNIPKVGIVDANVVVGGEDLSKSLVQFAGPLPGQNGNPVIFGHSTLPFLYNPKVYTTIFTKLPDLTKNDEIIINIDGIIYRYTVYEMKVVTPDTLSILNQQYNYADLTLVTCVPPGTYFKRLVVKARLQSI